MEGKDEKKRTFWVCKILSIKEERESFMQLYSLSIVQVMKKIESILKEV